MPNEKTLYRVVDVLEPAGTVRVIRDHWWWCVDGDPKKAIFYVGRGWRTCWSPQCNTDRRIVESLEVPFVGAEIVKIPRAFAPQREDTRDAQ